MNGDSVPLPQAPVDVARVLDDLSSEREFDEQIEALEGVLDELNRRLSQVQG